MMLLLRSVQAVIGATVLGGMCSGCLFPQDRVRIEERINSAPEFDVATVFPPNPVLSFPFDCRDFRVRARVKDKNDPSLMFRLVSFDGERQRNVSSGEISGAEASASGEAGGRVVPGSDFPLLVDRADVNDPQAENQVGVLSLFVTDAAEWAVPDEDLDVTDRGLGEIVNPETSGFEPYSVSELRWTVLILAESGGGGECL